MKFRLKSKEVEAEQWFVSNPGDVELYERPRKVGTLVMMGEMKSPNFNILCDGDWIVTESDGTKFTCNNDLFLEMYEEVK